MRETRYVPVTKFGGRKPQLHLLSVARLEFEDAAEIVGATAAVVEDAAGRVEFAEGEAGGVGGGEDAMADVARVRKPYALQRRIDEFVSQLEIQRKQDGAAPQLDVEGEVASGGDVALGEGARPGDAGAVPQQRVVAQFRPLVFAEFADNRRVHL